ncbi:hypothetical protein KPSA3_07434 [Pseudomonas syringae pv. actinidiae]|uniref:Uncharacterized protein n=1 Tax=Pseudomonas syringae pv. actinidiae TaxID=103796 RepID=A0AAN4QC94_PSESF|nr:hypothetical protein KPSA3_07434 [Pseudomonas syringae pv. actinidiae]
MKHLLYRQKRRITAASATRVDQFIPLLKGIFALVEDTHPQTPG